MTSADTNPAFGVYVHWPFCLSKCPYCDFNSHVRHAPIDEERFVRAFAREIETTAARAPGRVVSSIFLGGGTPSLMQPQTVGAILDAIGKHWRVARDVEVTLEANPTSVEAARFRGYRAAGVNRVSLGVQALDDASLKALGRLHTAREALDAVAIARAAFDRYSFDLIYARPGQSLAAWEAELARAIGFGTEHLSLYQLTIEPGTRFATEAAAGRLTIPDADTAADLFEATRAQTAAAGLPAYEVSNHALAGAESRHNLSYWRYSGYVGIGPGAHGRRNALATTRHRKPENWIAAVARNGHGAQAEEALSARDRATEALVMGLRLDEGIDIAALKRRGIDLAIILDEPAIDRLSSTGLIVHDEDRLRLTESGMPVLDAILREISVSDG